jgi:hypothetical protein
VFIPGITAVISDETGFISRGIVFRTQHGRSFLQTPRIFMAASMTCKAIRAIAPSCHPQEIHNRLLARNSQNPQRRLPFDCAPVNQAAKTVTAIAGHCSAVIHSMGLPRSRCDPPVLDCSEGVTRERPLQGRRLVVRWRQDFLRARLFSLPVTMF